MAHLLRCPVRRRRAGAREMTLANSRLFAPDLSRDLVRRVVAAADAARPNPGQHVQPSARQKAHRRHAPGTRRRAGVLNGAGRILKNCSARSRRAGEDVRIAYSCSCVFSGLRVTVALTFEDEEWWLGIQFSALRTAASRCSGRNGFTSTQCAPRCPTRRV